MAKVIFTNELRLADRIIRCLPKQKEIAERMNISKQKVSYRKENVYKKLLTEAIELIDMAGYVIIEKEKLDDLQRNKAQ